MTTGWKWDDVDELLWPHLIAMLRYWRSNPPLHILVKGIASGMAGYPIGEQPTAKQTPSTQIQSAEELLGIMRGAGLEVGVIHGSG